MGGGQWCLERGTSPLSEWSPHGKVATAHLCPAQSCVCHDAHRETVATLHTHLAFSVQNSLYVCSEENEFSRNLVIFLSWLPYSMFGILSNQGWKLRPLRRKLRVLTTGPPRRPCSPLSNPTASGTCVSTDLGKAGRARCPIGWPW